MSNVFPTSYSLKSSPDNTDVVWSSDWTTNFNLSVDWIGNKVFSDRDTSDLSEWTNLYYTDTRVLNSPAVTSLEADKAEKTNVLQLDNTTAYTPTADYHPATKAYVDSWTYPIASETVQGIIEIATNTEVMTWTDTTRAVTSSWISNKYWNTFTPFLLAENTEYTAASPLVVAWYWTNQFWDQNLISYWYIWISTADIVVLVTPGTSSVNWVSWSFFVPKWYKFKVDSVSWIWITGSQFYAYPFIS